MLLLVLFSRGFFSLLFFFCLVSLLLFLLLAALRHLLGFSGLLLHVLALLWQAEERIANPFGDGDDIGVAFLVDLDLDALFAVDPGDDLAVLMRADDLGDIAQINIGIALTSYDQLGDLIDCGELVERADQIFDLALAQVAAGQIDVVLG